MTFLPFLLFAAWTMDTMAEAPEATLNHEEKINYFVYGSLGTLFLLLTAELNLN